MSDYTPNEEHLLQHYRELSETVSGDTSVGEQNVEIARRTIAKIKADVWDELVGRIESDMPFDVAELYPNPYREQETSDD